MDLVGLSRGREVAGVVGSGPLAALSSGACRLMPSVIVGWVSFPVCMCPPEEVSGSDVHWFSLISCLLLHIGGMLSPQCQVG